MGFTEKSREIEEMNAKLYTDSLSNVKNRKFYDEELSFKLCQGLVIADIDNFKEINDTYGHQVGDVAISKVANALKSSVRKSDNVVRYGGDEFIISFSEITKDALKKSLEKMKSSIENIRIEGQPSIHLTMSFGATYGTSTVEEMFKDADDALYKSKETKNTITLTPFNKNKVLKRIKIK